MAGFRRFQARRRRLACRRRRQQRFHRLRESQFSLLQMPRRAHVVGGNSKGATFRIGVQNIRPRFFLLIRQQRIVGFGEGGVRNDVLLLQDGNNIKRMRHDDRWALRNVSYAPCRGGVISSLPRAASAQSYRDSPSPWEGDRRAHGWL